MRRLRVIFISIILVLCLGMINDAYAASINKRSITLTKTKTYKLKLKGTSIAKVSTSNKNVAIITKKGVVKAIGKGKCTVAIKGKDKKTYKCTVNVQAPKLNATSLSLIKGKKYDLNLSGTSKGKVWSTSNKKVATVTKGGVIKAVSKGTVYVRVKCDGITYSCKVKVETPKLNISSKTLYVGDSLDLNVTGTSKLKQWYSSNTSMARIDKKGYVTALKAGSTNVNVKIDGVVFSCKLTIKENVSLYGKKVSIIGDSISTYKDSIVKGYKACYPYGNVTNVSNTWWKKLCNETGLSILSNASYSTSKCVGDSISESNGYAACSNKRINDLSKDGISPDIVICYIGINDFVNSIPLGDWLTSKKSLVGSTSVSNFSDAYSLMLDKIRNKYPSAKIYCCTLIETALNKTNITMYNETIKSIASYYGAGIIDLYNSGINKSSLSLYMVDGNLHPNIEGMNLIKTKVKEKLASN